MRKVVMSVLMASLMLALVASVGVASAQAAPGGNSCWGQASAVFAQTGQMGKHSSQQTNPRLGLRNLARYLYQEGVIADDSMQALGAFVAAELGLSIDACQ